MMIEFDSVWIDMDGTLMDWSKGNVQKALIDIADPDYYLTLKPIEDSLPDYLQSLKGKGKKLNIISGIPDFVCCYHVPIFNYKDYYDMVCKAKDYTIEKYFKGMFDTVNYTVQSQSKAKYVKDRYFLRNPVFIDDMDKYIIEWKKEINDNAFKVDEEHSCGYYLKSLLDSL